MNRIIRTLVVDDSAFVRKTVREMLSRSPYIEVVGVARDGEEALALVETLKPDVITCDLIMPQLDGVGFVKRQMASAPLPILILTSSPHDGEQVLEALHAGAVDLVQKPTSLATNELLVIRDELVEKVKAAARAPVANLLDAKAHSFPSLNGKRSREVDIVVLGISTGGPQALRYLLRDIPENFPVPMAIVLHMPVGYTGLFAQKLDEISPLEVREARDGDPLVPGVVLLAPAGRHLHLRRTLPGNVVAQLSMHPLEKSHRPSVDVLFRSAAETYGSRVLGVVMTGMGDDGREGAAWIKAQGGRILTEDEKSCIIYGMPRSVVESGLSDGTAPLDTMARAILEHL